MTGEKAESQQPTVSPDPSLCEPGFISNGWDSRVHQRMGLDERQGIIWKVDGGFVSFREAVFGTTARPEMKTATFNHSLILDLSTHSGRKKEGTEKLEQ